MKELKISVIYGGSCPPQADPLCIILTIIRQTYSISMISCNGGAPLQIPSTPISPLSGIFTVCTVMLPWRISSLTKHGFMERYKPSTVNTRIYGINQYVAASPVRRRHERHRTIYPAASIDFLEPYKLPSVRHQQKPFLNNVLYPKGL